MSTLQPANVRLRRVLRNAEHASDDDRFQLLFDPQTSGGLLASVAREQAQACLAALLALGYACSAIIGEVEPQSDALKPVTLVI
jgi:selenide,water dikinase